MRTLVTGGAGFIGTHVVARLLDLGDDVVVLDSFEQQVHGGEDWSYSGDVTLLRGDVGDAVIADTALKGVDRVVHLAAAVGVGQSMYEIERYTRINSLATAVFLQQLVAQRERPHRLVVASSMSIYGEGEYVCEAHGAIAPEPRSEAQLRDHVWECLCPECGRSLAPTGTPETKPLAPTSVYAIGKRDQEELSLVVGAAYGVPTTALRFFNVYGSGQALSNPYTGVAAIFSSRLLNRRPPLIFEDGLQSRDFIHVSDIVDAIMLTLTSDEAAGRVLNLGTGRPTTVLDVARALGNGLGIEIEPEIVGKYRAGDIRHCFADATLANDVLGFAASVSLDDGMADLIRWLADQEPADEVDAATSELVSRGLAR